MAEMIELKEQEERVILVAVSTGEDDDTAARWTSWRSWRLRRGPLRWEG